MINPTKKETIIIRINIAITKAKPLYFPNFLSKKVWILPKNGIFS